MKKISTLLFCLSIFFLSINSKITGQVNNFQSNESERILQAEQLLKTYFSSKLFDEKMMNDYQTRSFEFKFKNRGFIYSFMDEVIQLYKVNSYSFDTLNNHFFNYLDKNAGKINFNVKDEKEIEGTMHLGMQNKQFNGPCVNMDFEQGNLNGWDMFEGDVNNAPYVMINAVQIGAPGAHHTIMTGGNDPVVGAALPMVNPNGGGGFSLRLGDGTGTGSRAASVRQTFLVDANNAAFVYSYAVVLENPGHTTGEQPFFKINMYDQNGASISCGEYAVIPSSGANSDWVVLGGVEYLPWTTTFAPLDNYIGQNVTIEFVVGDCSQSGHYGYAYVDAQCNPLEIITSSPAVCGSDAVVLTAPAGAASYLWNTGATTQTITTSTPGTYNVTVTPITGAACNLVLNLTITGSPGEAIANFDIAPINVCVGETITVNDLSTGTNGTTVDQWDWDFGDGTLLSNVQTATHAFTTAGTYDVQLVAGVQGCLDTLIQQVVVQAGPIASFTAPPVCQGTVTQFTNTSTGAIANYAWDFTSNGTVDNTNVNTTHGFPAAGTYNVTLTISTSNGCISSVTQPVIVNTVPVVDFTPNAVCQGTLTQFNDLSTVSSGTINNWFWDFGQAGATSTLQNPTFNYATSGAFNASLTVTSNQGCISTGTQLIDVYPVPTANFTLTNVCEGVAVTFTDNSAPNGGSINIFDWDFTNDGIVDFSGSTTSFTYPAAGSYAANLSVTNTNGCSSEITLPVEVFTSPVVSFTGQNVCQGGTVQFTNNSSVSTGTISSYNWDFGNGSFSAIQNPTSPYPNEGVYTVQLSVTSSNGCVQVASVPITIYPTPTPLFFTSNVCDGQATTFTDVSSVSNQFSPNNIASWSWNYGVAAGVNSTLQMPSTTYPTPGTYTVSLSVTTNNGCTASTTNPVTVNPNPVVNFSSPNPMGCTEWCVDFTNNVTVTSGSISEYIWNFGDGIASTDPNPQHCYTNSTLDNLTFTVALNVTTDQGCVGSFTIPNFVTVFPIPVANFNADPFVTNIYQTNVNFINQSQIAVGYNWDFAGLGTSTSLNPSFTFPDADAGVYPVCLDVISVNGCTHSYCADVIVEGVINVYVPNAFTPDGDGKNDIFIPSIYGLKEEGYQFMIFDRWGLLLYETESHDGGWDGIYQTLPVQQDVYVWKLKGIDKYTEESVTKIGHVSLLR
jgi:gliding motility-associated-like protein